VIADVLDRVLGGQDLDARLVDALERAEQRGALARAGGAGDQDDPGGRSEQLAQPDRDRRAQAERLDRLREAAGVENADQRALAVVARDDRDPEVDRRGLAVAGQARAEASVLRPAPRGAVELPQALEPRRRLA